MDEWWNYNEIRFTREQILWLLKYADLLREGKWIPESMGHFDFQIGKRRVKTEASFVKPALIIAEIDFRLARAGEDGQTLQEEIESGLDDYDFLSTVAKSALNYIKGWRRRRPYSQWKADRKYSKKR